MYMQALKAMPTRYNVQVSAASSTLLNLLVMTPKIACVSHINHPAPRQFYLTFRQEFLSGDARSVREEWRWDHLCINDGGINILPVISSRSNPR